MNLLDCRVNTQQKSGPNTLVNLFLNSNSPALDYDRCVKEAAVREMLHQALTDAHLRRTNVITDNLTRILQELKGDEWNVLLGHLQTLKKQENPTAELEQSVVMYMQSGKFPGLGPKQSRNFLQSLGLSQNEIPLDSRVLNKLREFGCSFVPRSTALSDESVYRFVQSGLQQIAKKIGIFPCILDAHIFSSFDHAEQKTRAIR